MNEGKLIRELVRPECVRRVIKENRKIQRQFNEDREALITHHGNSVRHAGKGWGT